MAYIFSGQQEQLFLNIVDSYHAAQNGLLRRPMTALLHGPPGSGKTEFVREVASHTGAPLYKLVGSGIKDDKELFYTLDVRKIHQGTGMYQRTPLWEAVEHSNSEPVMFLLDEVDKGLRVDEALLQLLEPKDGYFLDPYNEIVQAKVENLFFFATSNGRRPLLWELLRRIRNIPFPAADAQKFRLIVNLQLDQSGVSAPAGLVNYAIKVAILLREAIKDPEAWPVPDEVTRLISDLTQIRDRNLGTTIDTLEFMLRMNIGKNAPDKRWEVYDTFLRNQVGRVGKALKTELYGS